MNPFPEQHALISIFETEPRLTDPDLPWSYNSLRFETARGADHIVCTIEPSYGVLQIQWTRNGAELLDLRLEEVQGLVAERERGRETLVASFRHDKLPELRLQLKPAAHLFWHT